MTDRLTDRQVTDMLVRHAGPSPDRQTVPAYVWPDRTDRRCQRARRLEQEAARLCDESHNGTLSAAAVATLQRQAAIKLQQAAVIRSDIASYIAGQKF